MPSVLAYPLSAGVGGEVEYASGAFGFYGGKVNTDCLAGPLRLRKTLPALSSESTRLLSEMEDVTDKRLGNSAGIATMLADSVWSNGALDVTETVSDAAPTASIGCSI